MTETRNFIFSHRHLYLLLNSLYIAGIIFIGTQVLLSAELAKAFFLSILTFSIYLGVVCLATILVNAFLKPTQSVLGPYKKAILVAGITAATVIPHAVLVNYLSISQMAPSKYYFYSTICSGIVFVTTTILGLPVDLTVMKEKERLEKLFTFLLELVKTILWVFAFVLFGTAFSQVLTGTPITSGEMFLIFYTSVGCVALVLVPILNALVDVLDQIISTENP